LSILPGKDSKTHRYVALLFSLRTLLLAVRLWSGFSPVFAVGGTSPFSSIVSFNLGWSGYFTVSLEFG
jgi:hypothetical protein